MNLTSVWGTAAIPIEIKVESNLSPEEGFKSVTNDLSEIINKLEAKSKEIEERFKSFEQQKAEITEPLKIVVNHILEQKEIDERVKKAAQTLKNCGLFN